MARSPWRILLLPMMLGLLLLGAVQLAGCGAPKVTDESQVTAAEDELRATQVENKYLKDKVASLEKKVKELTAEVKKLRAMPATEATPGTESATAAVEETAQPGATSTPGAVTVKATGKKAPEFDKKNPAWGAVNDLILMGVITQKIKDFKPNAPISRGEFVTWLVGANNAIFARRDPSKIINTRPVGQKFKDVIPGSEFYPFIQGMVEAGYIIDFDSTEFHPEQVLTREEMLSIKAARDYPRAFKTSPAAQPYLDQNFTDGAAVGRNYRTPVYMDLEHSRNFQRVYGYSRTLNPTRPVTQAEAAMCVWMVAGTGPR